MISGRMGPQRFRFDSAESPQQAGPNFALPPDLAGSVEINDDRLSAAVERTRDWLIHEQHPDGYWVGELQGDSILESEYILLLAYLGRENSPKARACANYLLKQQLPDGGWAIYPGGPAEISASVKAYFALKLTGHAPDADYMCRAREAIHANGGAEKVNSFTRYYLALLGVISYRQCPAVPPELILIPHWMPFNIYEMSAWSRTILIPLSLLWAHRPVRVLAAEQGIRELFLRSPQELPACNEHSQLVDGLKKKTWLDWPTVFRRIDQLIKLGERLHLLPLRRRAIRRARDWMLARFAESDGLGAIFPPIIWSVIALKCLGYPDDSPEIQAALGELDKLAIAEGNTLRLEPCKSPVWDTAISAIALYEAGIPTTHDAIRRARTWLLSKEVRRTGDWSVRNPDQEPSGWYFEFNNAFYPDVDDTSMVLIALCRNLPATSQSGWSAEFLLGNWSPHEADKDAAAIVSARGQNRDQAIRDLDVVTPQLTCIWRGARWLMDMQCRDGGWGAFDADNTRELFTQVPFADHNAMIDPSTADLTARMLELLADLKLPKDHPAVKQAIDFVWRDQQPDGSWYGRWGVNYIYGTWQALVGLTAIGIPTEDPRIQRAAAWLISKQQPNGAWGESPGSYDEPALRGVGPATASQTAWAVMGLIAAGRIHAPAVRSGIEYLVETQLEDGTWDEPWFTGTGFPKVFYLKYHLYRVYFPLMALGRYARLRHTRSA